MPKIKKWNRKIIICKGLPASGKSLWAKDYVSTRSNICVRINRDDIRHMLGKYWIPSREELVTKIEKATFVESLKMGYNIVLDSTNLNPKVDEWVREYAETFLDTPIPVEIKDFTDVPLQTCIIRDRNMENPVGESVIRRMYYKYILPYFPFGEFVPNLLK